MSARAPWIVLGALTAACLCGWMALGAYGISVLTRIAPIIFGSNTGQALDPSEVDAAYVQQSAVYQAWTFGPWLLLAGLLCAVVLMAALSLRRRDQLAAEASVSASADDQAEAPAR